MVLSMLLFNVWNNMWRVQTMTSSVELFKHAIAAASSTCLTAVRCLMSIWALWAMEELVLFVLLILGSLDLHRGLMTRLLLVGTWSVG